MAHVPQERKQVLRSDKPGRNPYHAECPICNAKNGEYCQIILQHPDRIDRGLHPERRALADAAPVCVDCQR